MMPRTMRFRRNMVFGALLAAAAAASLALLRFQSPWPVGVSMLLMGLGIGISLPPGIVAVQVAVAPTRTGAATAFLGLARSLGSALGLACLTSVLFAALGRSADGSAGTLVAQAGQAQPALAGGFALVFACTSAALLLSAAAAMRLPQRQSPAA
jgi:hypothetical protein